MTRNTELSKSSTGDAVGILYFLMTALMPIIVLSATYGVDSNITILHLISDKLSGIPSFTSSKNFYLTKALDIYCKTSPLMAFFVFLKYRSIPIFSPDAPFEKKVKAFIFYSLIYSISFYMIFFKNVNLDYSIRFLKLASINSLTLTLFYLGLYVTFYILTFLYLSFLKNILTLFKERW